MVAITTLFTGGMGGFGGMFGNIFGGGKRGFSKKLKLADFSDTGSLGAGAVTVSNDKFYKLAQFTIPAQQVYNLGYGNPNQPLNQGYVYIYLKDSGASEITMGLPWAMASNTTIPSNSTQEGKQNTSHEL